MIYFGSISTLQPENVTSTPTKRQFQANLMGFSRIEWHQEEKVPKPLQLGIRGEIHSAWSGGFQGGRNCVVFVGKVPETVFVVGDFTMVTSPCEYLLGMVPRWRVFTGPSQQ